jgi:hypothetical protein
MGTQPSQTSSAMTSALTDVGTTGALVSPSTPAAPSSLNVASVKTHVPVVLDLAKSNYSKWRMLISVLLGKYELSDHVAFETPAADRTAEWNREDFIVRSWLYGSISDEILDIIMAENQSAFDAYMLIRNLFLDNGLGCKLCGKLETADHLIFQCPLSNFTWRCLKEAMGWS